ncbi:MAG: GAF domain-containing protein [Chloroflexi bacterium]|nr:MAG: GAF domain-containing protein [Chloroflexota bacterium]
MRKSMNLKNILDIFRKRTLARDLALRLAAVTTISIVLLGAAYYFVSVTQAERDLTQQATRRIEELADVLAIPVWNLDDASIEQIATVYLQSENVVAMRVLDDTASPMYESLADEPDTIVETRPIIYNEEQVGTVEIEVSRQQVVDLRQNIMFLVFGIVVVIAAAILVAAWFLLQTYLGSPLTNFTESLNSFAGGNYSQRLDSMAQEEFNVIARQFNAMADQIQARDQFLEQRVADRTKALTTSAEVSRRLSTILNERQLIIEVVEQVQAAFDYYHVHIYMLDETNGNLIMAGGTGDVGASMLGSGHKISKGKGLVGRAAENNVPVLVSDTSKDPNWLPNPLLPETRSEAAVPIATADKVLGVLDVQDNEIGGLKQEDVDLLQSLANQVAIALLNARSYVDLQQRADREARITSIGLKIKSTTSIEAALQATARELGRTLGVNDIRVILEAPGTINNSQKPD